MQDTPEFSRLQQIFTSSFTEDVILAPQSSQPINKPESDTISRAFEYAQLYFNDTPYRQTLSLTTRQNIEAQLSAISDQLNQVNSFRAQNNLAANLQSIINNIGANLDELRTRFITPHSVYILQGNKSTITDTLNSLEASRKTAEEILEKLKDNLDLTNEAIGTTTDQDLASYFYELYNGNPDNKGKVSRTPARKKRRSITIKLCVAAVTVLIATLSTTKWLLTEYGLQKEIFIGLGAIVGIVILIWAVVSYYRKFSSMYAGGYEKAAQLWLHAVVVAIIITAGYSIWVLHTFKIDPKELTLSEAIVKGIVLLAPVYLIRFSVRNFNANKHLATINLQRATSIKTFRGFVKPLDTVRESNQKEVYAEIVKLIFAPEESGFITRRDGAGSSESGSNPPWLN